MPPRSPAPEPFSWRSGCSQIFARHRRCFCIAVVVQLLMCASLLYPMLGTRSGKLRGPGLPAKAATPCTEASRPQRLALDFVVKGANLTIAKVIPERDHIGDIIPWSNIQKPRGKPGRNNLSMLLMVAAELEGRENPGFNPNDAKNRHWRTDCWLCRGGVNHTWPRQFGKLGGRQLLADDYVVARRDSFERFQAEPLERSRLALAPSTEPFESKRFFGFPGSALHNGTHFLLFYSPNRSPSKLALAVSTSAVGPWKRVLANTSTLPWWSSGDMCVLIDAFDPVPARKFKMVFNCAVEPKEWPLNWSSRHVRWSSLHKFAHDNPVCLASSPDGLAWTMESPLAADVGDTLACLHHEERGGPYHLLLRQNYATPYNFRAIRGSKVLVMQERDFQLNFLTESMRKTPVKAQPWRVLNEWYFDAEYGKPEGYKHQIYAHSRSRDPTGLFWGFTHMVKWIVPPLTNANWNIKNEHLQKLWRNHAQYFGGERIVDAIVPFLSTSRDGSHFDLSTVYGEDPMHLQAPERTRILQPAASMVSPGDGFHYIFFSASEQPHRYRWDTWNWKDEFGKKDVRLAHGEHIYVTRFREGRLIGLRAPRSGPGGRALLLTKPLLLPDGARELGIDASLEQGATLRVEARGRGGEAACWSATLTEGAVADATALGKCAGQHIQLAITISGENGGQLFSFALGGGGALRDPFRLRLP